MLRVCIRVMSESKSEFLQNMIQCAEKRGQWFNTKTTHHYYSHPAEGSDFLICYLSFMANLRLSIHKVKIAEKYQRITDDCEGYSSHLSCSLLHKLYQKMREGG